MSNSRELQREASTRRIVENALEEFAEHGYTGTKLSEIGAGAGVVKSLILQRFQTKENLFFELVRMELDAYLAFIPHNFSLSDSVAMIAERIKINAAADDSHFRFASMAATSHDLPDGFHQKMSSYFSSTEICASIRREMEAGRIQGTDPYVSFRTFVQNAFGLTKSCLEAGITLPSDRDYNRFLEVETEKEAEDVKRPVLLNADHDSDVVRTMFSDYSSIYWVDLDNDRVERFGKNDKADAASGKRIQSNIHYTDAIRIFSKSMVQDNFRQEFLSVSSIPNVEKELKKKKFFRTFFRDANGNFCEIRFVKIGSWEKAHKAVLALAEKNDEILNHYINRQLEDEYIAVYLIDLVKDKYFAYKLPQTTDIMSVGYDTWTEACTAFAQECTSDTRDIVMEFCDAEAMKNRMQQTNRREFVYLHDRTENKWRRAIVHVMERKNGDAVTILLTIARLDDFTAEKKEIDLRLKATVEERTEELKERNKELFRMSEGIVSLLGELAEGKEGDNGDRIQRFKGYTLILASQMARDWPELNLNSRQIDMIALLSPLHDIGKALVSDKILLKPGKLAADELTAAREHTVQGEKLLGKLYGTWNEEYSTEAMHICRSHHERWDGSGYPDGLKGNEIPLSAQIVSLVDVYSALVSKRPFREPFSHEQAVQMILNGECGVFSEKLLISLKRCQDHLRRGTESSIEEAERLPEINDRLKGIRLLVVDDNRLSLELNQDILEDEGAETRIANNGFEALEILGSDQLFDAILMDIVMPDMDGVETTKRIREKGIQTPVIALTADASGAMSNEMLTAGAAGCLGKPLVISELTGILFTAMKETRQKIEEKLEYTKIIASTDALTHVKNITAYMETMRMLSDNLTDFVHHPFSILMCDVNGLKNINDQYGHSTGDLYIQNCVSILCRVFPYSSVYRIGGDEFVVILEGEDYHNRDFRIGELQISLETAMRIENVQNGKTSFAFGLATYEKEKDGTVDDIFKRADKRMYQHKKLVKEREGMTLTR